MSRVIGDARAEMQRSLEDAAQVGPVPSLLASANDPVDRAERNMLQALVRGDITEMEVQSNALWQALVSRDAAVDVGVLRESLNRSLGFLVRSARNRGLSASPDASVLIEENHTTRQDLRVAFLERTKELVLPDRSSSGSFFSQRVMQFLQDNYRRDISLRDLSSYLGISESHCSREITRHFGRSFRRLLRETRLQVARRLLADPSLVIQDVAEFSGFQDPNYFSRVFKELYGMSPRVYRNTVGA
jgi:AraC-like DNA-binding protein